MMAVTTHLAPTYVGGAALVLVFLLLARMSRIGRRPKDFPPGPPTLPLLGNLHQMPTDARPHLQFQKWAEEYGPVYSLILGTKVMIVVNSDVDIKELLDRRSGTYSDRPEMYIGQKIASGNLRFVLMHYGEQWRTFHKMIHNILNIKAAVTYVPYQDLENTFMLNDLLDTPENVEFHLRRYSFSLSTQMIFGWRCPDSNDKNLRALFTNFEKWSALVGSSSAQLVDLYPMLQKIPAWLMPSVRHAQKNHLVERAFYVRHYRETKQRLDNGTGLPCFCNDIYREQTVQKFSDEAASYLSGSLLDAGSDTTSSVLYGFILAMVVFPEAQARLHEELDRVVGQDRMPTADDMENLPYVRCCVKESLRWMPTIIMGVPHASMRDDVYKGWRIPKGATVISNNWAIQMDARRHDKPREFRPDRFRDDHANLYQSAIGDTTKRDNFIFGSGRRICQGIHIAERSLFLAISRLGWAFDFTPALDKAGKPVQYDIEALTGGIAVQPEAFACTITARTPEKRKQIREAAEACRALLDPVTLQWKAAPKGMAFSTWMPDNKVNND